MNLWEASKWLSRMRRDNLSLMRRSIYQIALVTAFWSPMKLVQLISIFPPGFTIFLVR